MRSSEGLLLHLVLLAPLMWAASQGQPRTIRVPPSMVDVEGIPFHTDIIYRTGDTIVIPCKATGHPKPRYKWLFNGNIWLDHPNVKQSSEDGTITIEDASSLDAGTYQCEASSYIGRAYGYIAKLTRAVFGRYPDRQTRIYKVQEGDRATLICEALRSIPEASVVWQLAEDKFDASPEPLDKSVTSKTVIDAQGNLHFAFVSVSDMQAGRLYRCDRFNSRLDISTAGSYSSLQVQTGNLDNRVPEEFIFPPQQVVALEGDQEVMFQCFFSGRPVPSIGWSRTGGSLPRQHQILETNTVLKLLKVSFDYAGEYSCTGTNPEGQATRSFELVVQSKPTFKSWMTPTSVNVTEGDAAAVTCGADGEPQPDITWYLNGERVDASTLSPYGGRMRVEEDQFILTNTCRHDCYHNPDFMVVQCNASNIHGYAYKNAYINILDRVQISDPPVTEQVYQTGQTEVTFTCTAEGDDSTPIYYEWLQHGTLLADNMGFGDGRLWKRRVQIGTTQDGVSQLMIDVSGLRAQDLEALRGEYTCLAWNGYSRDQATGLLIVPQIPAGKIWTKYAGYAIRDKSVVQSGPATLEECKTRCLNTTGCLSINYHQDATCWMSHKNRETASMYQYGRKSGSDYYEWNYDRTQITDPPVKQQEYDSRQSVYIFTCKAVTEHRASFKYTWLLDGRRLTGSISRSFGVGATYYPRMEISTVQDGSSVLRLDLYDLKREYLQQRFKFEFTCEASSWFSEDKAVGKLAIPNAPTGIKWTKYTGFGIDGFPVGFHARVSVEECKARCVNMTGCLSVDYNQDTTCWMSSKNRGDAGQAFSAEWAQEYGYDYYEWHYDRDCLDNQFLCLDSSDCIDAGLVCNGKAECADSSDEINCIET